MKPKPKYELFLNFDGTASIVSGKTAASKYQIIKAIENSGAMDDPETNVYINRNTLKWNKKDAEFYPGNNLPQLHIIARTGLYDGNTDCAKCKNQADCIAHQSMHPMHSQADIDFNKCNNPIVYNLIVDIRNLVR